jgi:hypothetical protein
MVIVRNSYNCIAHEGARSSYSSSALSGFRGYFPYTGISFPIKGKKVPGLRPRELAKISNNINSLATVDRGRTAEIPD